MKIANYLDKCKEKLNVTSTYALAEALDIDQRRMQEFYKGVSPSNEFLCFKIANVLEIDPAYVIADIKSETDKSEVRREFFKSIAGKLTQTAKVSLLVLALLLPVQSLIATGGGFKRRSGFV